MTVTEVALRLLSGVVLLAASGVFVGSEFALTRVPQFDESEFAGARGLERAWSMTDRLEIYLSGCQFGITVTSIGLGVLVEPAVTALFEPVLVLAGLGGTAGRVVAATAAVVVLNLVYVVVGEQVPTYLGIERTRTAARYLSGPLYVWTRVMYPAIRFSDLVTKGLLLAVGVPITRSWAEEGDGEGTSVAHLRQQIGDALAGGSVSPEHREEVINVVEIEERPVTEILVPREDVVALSTADDPETNLDRLRTSEYDRFPLVGEDLGDFEGVVYGPTALANLEAIEAGERTFADVATPPLTVDAGTPVSELIDRLQAERQELALVVDDGEVVGLVTATDAFEAIVGELTDPVGNDAEEGAAA